MKRFLGLLFALMAMMLGCGEATDGDACAPNSTVECLCLDGVIGHQECNAQGTGFLDLCSCDEGEGGSEETDAEETGDEETGAEETGDEETGDEETGAEETGDEETGDEETGDEETGDEETGAETCLEDYDFFVTEVWNPILAIQCTGCHNAAGTAAQSQMVFEPPEIPGALNANFETLTAVALTEFEGTSLLLLKPTGLHPDGHTGGKLVPPGTLHHARLEEFVARVSGALDPCADPPPTEGECTGTLAGKRLLRRLTRFEYDNTIADLIGLDSSWGAGFTPEDVVHGFDNHAHSNPVSALFADQARKAAEEVAALAIPQLNPLADCSPTTKEDELACCEEFIATFGRRAFRRPLEADEIARYVQLYQLGRALDIHTTGLELVVTGMLQSPHFLYRMELGAHQGDDLWHLSPYEIASQLSYFLWGTMPDEELFAAAENGTLETEQGLSSEVQRLLNAPRRDAMLAHFAAQWLDVTGLSYATKDPEAHPEFTEEIREALTTELEEFMARIVFEKSGKLTELFLTETTFTTDTLAAFYDLPAPSDVDSAGIGEVSLAGSPRRGLLTLGSVLTTHAFANGSSPIHRGLMVREQLLCQELPPPPPGIVANPPAMDPELTTRERFVAHASVEPCFSCHKLFDPIGFGMEHFDAVGRYRETENGLTIDATGEILNTPNTNGAFDGVLELAEVLAASPDIHACHVKQWFRYGLGVEDDPSVDCLVSSLEDAFSESGTHVPTLLEALATSPHVRLRYDSPPEEGWDTPSPPLEIEIPSPPDGGIEVNDENLVVEQVKVSEWPIGYCSDVTVSNAGDYPIAWIIQLPILGTIYNLWNATMTPAGEKIQFEGPEWQKEIAGGDSFTFGFCSNL